MLTYLKGTVDLEWCYKKNYANLKLVAYSDTDWAADLNDRHSVTGYCFSLSESGLYSSVLITEYRSDKMICNVNMLTPLIS